MPQFPAIGAFGAFRAEDELADNCAIYALGAAHEFTNLVNGKAPVLGGTGASVASAYGPHGGALSTGGNANGFVTLGDASDFVAGTGDFSAAICIRKGSLVNSFGFVVAGHIEILIGESGISTFVRWRQNNATYAGGSMVVPDVEDYQMFVYSRQNGVESHWMNGVLQFRDTIGPLNLTPASGMVIGKRGNTATYYAIPGVAMTGFWRRGLSDDEVVKLSADPFLLARPKERTYLVVASTGAISGSSTVAFSTSATLTGTGALSGAASFAFTTTGSMGAPGLMSGTSTVAFSTTATLRGTGRLLGVSSPAFTTSATLTASGKLSGASTVAFTTSGTLTQPGAISGTASIAFSTAGTLRGVGALSGSTALTFTATAIPSGGAIWTPVTPSSASWTITTPDDTTWTLTAPDDSIWTPIT